jgi:hypothetical protein
VPDKSLDATTGSRERTTLRLYLWLYAFITAVSIISLAVPNVLLVVLLFSFGLLFPILFVPTLWVYLTALLPAVLGWHAGSSRLATAAIALLGVSVVALVPGLAARWAVQIDARPILALDIAGHLPDWPRQIEFERPARYYGGLDDPLRTAACDQLCQTLLLSRAVDAVRVSAIEKIRKPMPAVVYSYEERATCPKAFPDAAAALPATQMAASRGRCIVAAVAGQWTPGVKVVTTEQADGWRPRWQFLSSARDLTRQEVLVAGNGGWQLISRRTELRAKILRIPLLLGFPFSTGMHLGPGWERTAITINKTDPADALAATLGFRGEMPDPGGEPVLVTIDRILTAEGNDKLGPELMAVINRHLESLRPKPALSPEDVALVGRLIANRRVTDHFRVFVLLERHPAAAAGMVSDILDRLEEPVPEAVGHNHSHLSWVLARAPIDSLKPLAPRILEVASRSDEWPLSPLLRVTGRLGVDPTYLLTRRLNAKSHYVREAAAMGVCTADEPWASALAPHVETILDQYRGKSYGGNTDLVIALKIMRRAGRSAAVSAFLTTLSEADARRINAEVFRRPVEDATYCGH